MSLTMRLTESVVFLLISVYRVNAPWAALLVICSTVLLLLSIFGLFVQSCTVAPDIFNHASSLTRVNLQAKAPDGGPGLDGADRAHLLQKMRVRLGNTDSQAETEYVAFRDAVGDGDCREGKIRTDRRYR
jgi:hypothetical protein